MASKPMLTFLTVLLQGCRMQGTSVRESGITVSTEILAGETIIFFHLDCDEGRTSLKMTDEGVKICDYIIFYTEDKEDKEIVCFLEPKGTDLKVAAKQVEQTHKHTAALSNENIHRKHHQHITWRICICLRGQAPSTNQRIRDQLKQNFGKGNVEIKHGITRHDIGPLLRRKPNE
jgi:hypothetical protein